MYLICLHLSEDCSVGLAENDGFTCTGTIKHLARFLEDFPKHVSEEEKKAITNMICDANSKKKKMQ